ncbi:beta-galactosidase [Kineococcus gynurae]|uniref:Beta-galactosidase n=1 Tax=Kineococcus gynurae TaxID=452979 RepID=A0ABV5LV36_9ACTN
MSTTTSDHPASAPTPAGAGRWAEPWYRRARRFGQTNLVEADPGRFDVGFWRRQWRRTGIDAVFVNCGGIAAYYPSAVEGHQLAPGIDRRDLFGEVLTAARADGLAVVARMDSNRGDEQVFRAHPDWFCVDAAGEPYRRGDKYATCVSSDYYDEFMPSIFREVIDRYAPDGFADNGWAGIDRDKICYCANCARRFADATGRDLPRATDFDDPDHLAWLDWNYARRTELWDANNAVTRGAGGPDCLWLGMLHGQIAHNAAVFQDTAELAARTPIILLDHQRRHGDEGFEQNAEVVKRLHGVLGYDKPVFECTALYDMGYPAFRLSSMPRAEVELWMTEGWAGGSSPWWHHIGSVHEDRRQYENAVDLFGWHREHQDLLTDRTPVARVGVVWSQRNFDLHGRGDGPNTVIAPYAGFTRVLVTENVPFVPVHVDRIATTDVDVLVLPDLAVMSDAQCDAVREFAARGGSVVATGATSSRDVDGRERDDLALADLFGARRTGGSRGGIRPPIASIEVWDRHSYLRVEDPPTGRHPVLAGLGDTDTLSFGGFLPEVRASEDSTVLLTYVPEFPIFPPETSWMRTPRTDVPALLVREGPGGGRVVYLPADLDRCSHREEQPDHARVLAGCLEWVLDGRNPVRVESPAPVNVNLWAHRSGQVLHLNNLLYSSTVPGRQDRIVPYGPIDVAVRVPEGERVAFVRGLVDAGDLEFTVTDGWVEFRVARLGSHEVVHLGTGPA